jgi:lipopolysaccharide biosynthesis protein
MSPTQEPNPPASPPRHGAPGVAAPAAAPAPGSDPVRLIAFHLPQFHPTPENDAWWGKGFTEWTNVARARPLFPGHDQPHLPADLGFYDLRLPEARAAQADLARAYGLHGFCYYHYWFGGRRLLERPVDAILDSGQPDFPFCLCWANEPWSRRWDGSDREVLMPQPYSAEDDLRHIRWLARAFRDPRAIRVDGRPLFLVYRAGRLPDPPATTRRWRDECDRLGVGEIFLARVESAPGEAAVPPGAQGFDASVEFAPRWDRLGPRLGYSGRAARLVRALRREPAAFARHVVTPYDAAADLAESRPLPPYPLFRCATPRWDNSPRRAAGAHILHGSTPARYGRWLARLVEQAAARPPGHRVVFVNAWNEWAEGCHLEPDQAHGHAYLEATLRALRPAGSPGGPP